MTRQLRTMVGGMPFVPCPVEDKVIAAVVASMWEQDTAEQDIYDWRYGHESTDRYIAAIIRNAPPLSLEAKFKLAHLLWPTRQQQDEQARLQAERRACHKKMKKVSDRRQAHSSP